MGALCKVESRSFSGRVEIGARELQPSPTPFEGLDTCSTWVLSSGNELLSP
jgi:hypothetical protein